MKLFSKNIEIELGTDTTKITKVGSGTVIAEPSVVAVDKSTDKCVTAGVNAQEIIRTVPDNVLSIKPIKNGVIYDFDYVVFMLDFFLRKVNLKIHKYTVISVVPSSISPLEKKAFQELFKSIGARNVIIMEKTIAAALDYNLPIKEADGVLVLDIGDGTTEIATIALDEIVSSKSIITSGNSFDRAIIGYIKDKYNICIGEGVAREIKHAIGDVASEHSKSYIVVGRDTLTGLPNKCTILSDDVKNALSPQLDIICEAVKEVLDNTPIELVSHIKQTGMYLCGGSSKLGGICEYISNKTGIQCKECTNE